MRLESEVQQDIQIEAAKYGCILMRNNSGALKDATGRVVRYGLDNTSKERNKKIKSSDLIGITSVVITQDMVGKTIGVFTAVEVKREDWSADKKLDEHEQAQKNFLDFVIAKGGIAAFLNCASQVKTDLSCLNFFTDRSS